MLGWFLAGEDVRAEEFVDTILYYVKHRNAHLSVGKSKETIALG